MTLALNDYCIASMIIQPGYNTHFGVDPYKYISHISFFGINEKKSICKTTNELHMYQFVDHILFSSVPRSFFS